MSIFTEEKHHVSTEQGCGKDYLQTMSVEALGSINQRQSVLYFLQDYHAPPLWLGQEGWLVETVYTGGIMGDVAKWQRPVFVYTFLNFCVKITRQCPKT